MHCNSYTFKIAMAIRRNGWTPELLSKSYTDRHPKWSNVHNCPELVIKHQPQTIQLLTQLLFQRMGTDLQLRNFQLPMHQYELHITLTPNEPMCMWPLPQVSWFYGVKFCQMRLENSKSTSSYLNAWHKGWFWCASMLQASAMWSDPWLPDMCEVCIKFLQC